MAQWSAHGRQPRPGKVLRGASHGADNFLLPAQTTDGPWVDVKKFSGVHPVPSRLLEDCADDGRCWHVKDEWSKRQCAENRVHAAISLFNGQGFRTVACP
jgi:beta-xylosidase